jgi:hypothetical protein
VNIDPYRFTIDGVSLGTYAHMIEVVRGLDVLAGRVRNAATVAFRHGTIPTADWYFDEKVLPLVITVAPWDADGDLTHGVGDQGHLRDNLDELLHLFGKRSLLDVRRLVPSEESDELLELQAYATVGKTVLVDGGPVHRQFAVDLILPYPFWHELPVVELAEDTSHTFTTGGTAPVADMVYVLAGDGTVSDDLGHEFTISGSSGPVTVDVGAREVYEGGLLAMSLFDLDGGRDNWVEWPARTEVEVTSTVAVAVSYFNARH